MPGHYSSVFYGTLCHVCKSPDTSSIPLKRCSGCKLISYCSVAHQNEHWPLHKKLCKSIRSLLKRNNSTNIFSDARECSSMEEWNRIRFSVMVTVEISMKRKLHQAEREMFMFPRMCEICRECQHSVLNDCETCHSVSYCSEDHKVLDLQRHSASCLSLGICSRLNIFCDKEFMHPMVIVPIEETYKPLQNDLILFLDSLSTGNAEATTPDIYRALSSESLTYPLTVLHSLKTANILRRSSLVVHIVGSNLLECTFLSAWETIFHLLPDLTSLHLVLIGPEVQKCESVVLCDHCIGKGKLLNVDFPSENLYHDYMESKSKVIPDIVVAYNCGLHEYAGSPNDTWLPSIPYLLSVKQVCLVLTSFTQAEAEKDIECVTEDIKDDVKVLARCERNPFASLRPYRDWEHDGAGVFFQNAFISILVRE